MGSYVKKVQAEKKEEEQKQKLEKKRLELQKEQERIKVWLKSEKQNAPDKNSRKNFCHCASSYRRGAAAEAEREF